MQTGTEDEGTFPSASSDPGASPCHCGSTGPGEAPINSFLGSIAGFTGPGAALCSRTRAPVTQSSSDFGVTTVLLCTL